MNEQMVEMKKRKERNQGRHVETTKQTPQKPKNEDGEHK
jgi:hypothetical protein